MQIKLNIATIKEIIGATKCNLDDSFLIQNITSLENAGKDDIAVVLDRGEDSIFDDISSDKIKNSKAALILSKNEIVTGKNYLLVDNTLDAFCKILNFVEKNTCIREKNIHETVTVGQNVIIENGVSIDHNTSVGSNSFIGFNAKIGSNVKIYPGVKILNGSIIGNNCIIHSGTVIGSDGFGYSVTKNGLKKIPQIGIVKIGCNVEIGANCSIDRASFEMTIIGNGVKLDNQIHIAHNVKIGAHTVILAQTGIAGGAIIGFGCQIGGQVAIKDHIKIGNRVKIVSKSAVLKNIEEGEIVAGIPTMSFANWKRVTLLVANLPNFFKEFKKLKMLAKSLENKKSFLKRFWG
ncbi:UDP-3-O-(3-hydroxymyristoyl)glucosamine N-acyltransferase [Candidatus Dependentiae bacterium]|nr:UDP-3-O-(3-hydroxymyristoyl)glucosamine N-acyltransferase [Candidatus Dependentiae bacterium]